MELHEELKKQEQDWEKAEQVIKDFDSKIKYLSSYENIGTLSEDEERIYSKKQIKQKVYRLIQSGIESPYPFINSLKPALVIRREGKYHNLLCEYAIGTSCICWCNEKYHGLKGGQLDQLH